jgi:hypothetical protein
MVIRDRFENLSLHDASIEKIERSGNRVTIRFCGAFISKDHPESNGEDLVVEDGQLIIDGVTSEETKFWDDTRSPKEHPEPEFPLDEIMNASFKNGVFHFDGFKDSVPWYEWFVHANSFELTSFKHKAYGS